MAYLLGIDIGTSGTKALVCDLKGRVLGTATAEHDIASPRPGWSEQETAWWWESVCKATRAVVKKARVRAGDCRGIGLSGQMHGSVFLDDSGSEEAQGLRPALLWNDQRTAAECIAIERKAGGRRKLIEMVGNPALTGFTAPKILWLMNNEPRVYEKVRHVLLPKDFIRYKMTGEYATEVSDAAGMLLLDIRKRNWHKGLIGKLGFDAAHYAGCVESHEPTGKLTAWAAEQLGLRAGVVVVGGAGDNAAGAVGNGIVRGGVAMASLGTSGVIFAHSDKPVLDPKGRVHTMCHAVAGKWCVFGCMLSAGGSLQWFRNHMARDEMSRAKKLGVDAYELLMEEAERTERGCEGLMFLPYLTGERCPHPDPLARGGWLGLTARHTRGSMIRSVIEGITFGMTDGLRIMQGMGIRIDTIYLTGGGARSAFWRQLQADVYGVDTAVTNAVEGPAYGVAILAGVGTGVWKSVEQAAGAIIKETERREPDEEAVRYYRKAHKQYDRLYPALREEFPRLAGL